MLRCAKILAYAFAKELVTLEQRTRDILQLLLAEKNFQTTADLAVRLSVSAKTISRQLPKVEEILVSVGLQLEKKSGAGIKVVGSDVKRYALAKRLKSAEKREYTPNERRSVIISTLLSSREPIKLFALSSSVHVTDSTISNDLDKLEPWFREQGLKLLRKPGLGVSLLGDERDLRRAIVRYIYEHVGEENLLNLMQDNLPEDDEPVAQVSKFLLELIDAGEWRRLEQMIRVTENDLGYKLSDNAFIGLIVHLSLAVRRIKNHEPVKSTTIQLHACAGAVNLLRRENLRKTSRRHLNLSYRRAKFFISQCISSAHAVATVRQVSVQFQ